MNTLTKQRPNMKDDLQTKITHAILFPFTMSLTLFAFDGKATKKSLAQRHLTVQHNETQTIQN